MAHFTIGLKTTEEDFDDDGNIRAERIFHVFQDAAEQQVNSLGVGPADLIKIGHIWVLTKMHVRFMEEPEPGGSYLCTTYPVSQKRATFKRDFYINREADGVDPRTALIAGGSQWCILDYKTRRPVRADVGFKADPDEVDMMPGPFPKIHASEPEPVFRYRVEPDDVDYNDHCNNTVYIALMEKAAGRAVRDDLYVNFVSEVRFNETFELFTEKRTAEEGCIEETYTEGRRADGSTVFQAVFR